MIADNPHCCLISIHTPLAGSDRQPADHAVGRHISIHTPLAGSDFLSTVFNIRNYISIHTPLAGSDGYGSSQSSPERNFNPHSPCGERPSGEWITWASSHYFNPHSPCGERRGLAEMLEVLDISIHTPLAGSDQARQLDDLADRVFQSTLPLRGATWTCSTSTTSTSFQSTLPLRGATGRP